MRLVDLKPKWMRRGGHPIAIIFQCPGCVAGKCASKRLYWLTCTFLPIGQQAQRDMVRDIMANEPEDFAATGSTEANVVGCRPIRWKRSNKLFESMSISPSIDAGASGHWHGHIAGGMIVGGI